MKFSFMMIVAVLVIGVPVISMTNAIGAERVSTEAHEQAEGGDTAAKESAVTEPDLADIIPSASKLSGRLVALEIEITGLLDFSSVEKGYAEIEASLKDLDDQLERLKDSEDYKHNKLVELSREIERKNELFEEIGKPLRQAIRQLGDWRKQWLEEEKRWNQWQSFLNKEGQFDQLKDTFTKVQDTIQRAKNLIFPQLEAMLRVQEKAGSIQTRIHSLAAELDGQLVEGRHGGLLNTSPPIFSRQYFSQFRSSDLWYAIRTGVGEISWPDSRFFARQGWIVLIQGFISLFMIIAFYRNRGGLNSSERWRFLVTRPISAGLFLGFVTTLLIYEYEGTPAAWKLANIFVCGISFARLMGGLLEVSWKRHFVYGVTVFFIATRLLDVLSFPLPLFRLYIIFASLVGLLFCFWWAGESNRAKESNPHIWLLRLGSLYFAVIIIAELWGKESLALYLYVSLIRSIATVLALMLFMYMIHGGLEWLFRTSPLRRAAVLHSADTDAVIHRMARFIDVAILGLVVLPAILTVWGAYDSLEEATKGLLALGFNLGSQRITVGLIITSAGILYGSFLASWIVQKLVMDEVLLKRHVQKGVRLSMARLVHYVIILTGFIIALSTFGFDVTKLTIILSALGVGLGFGLQSIVNNFVSGLILLFERPVRVGDTIELGGKWAEIRRIGLRSTTVQTLDHADVIIPNSDLIANQVTNWTLSNRQIRLTIPVGVAYGSDVSLVTETLSKCADTNSLVAKTPAPQVLFLSFGESSLDFELRVWVMDADHRLKVRSELHQEIDRSFREAKIEIAFPQRDLHLRGADDSAVLRSSEKTG
ncbi:MAG: mechanosensitive ion channel family protein [Planctomycetota bacterium]|jgi:small-conductance mechanosensitive channel